MYVPSFVKSEGVRPFFVITWPGITHKSSGSTMRCGRLYSHCWHGLHLACCATTVRIVLDRSLA